jgi:putative tricarboxylic transport membrane protein
MILPGVATEPQRRRGLNLLEQSALCLCVSIAVGRLWRPTVVADTPLIIVAPAAPGGGWDQTARAMQHALAAVEPGASVQVENVPGAAGTIGLARFVTGERGNPHALLVTGLVMVGGIVTNRTPTSLADATPVARLTGEAEVIVVPADSPHRTLADLLGAFRANPSSVAWGGGSAGGTDDLLVRLMAEAIGMSSAQVNYIAFPGGGAALAALIGGQVTAGVSGYSEFAGQLQAGTLRALAVSSAARVAGLEAPTLREQGVPLDLANWRGVVAPPGLSDAERDAIVARVERLATSEAWRAVIARNGWDDMLLTGAPFRQFLLAEQHRVAAVLQRLDGATETSRNWLVPTPSTAPLVVVAALIVLAAQRAWGAIAETRKGPVAETEKGPAPFFESRAEKEGRPLFSFCGPLFSFCARVPTSLSKSPALVLTVVLLAHALIFERLGFIPASTLLFGIAAALFGSHRVPVNLAIGFITALALYGIFTWGLGLSLPRDPVTGWLFG